MPAVALVRIISQHSACIQGPGTVISHLGKALVRVEGLMESLKVLGFQFMDFGLKDCKVQGVGIGSTGPRLRHLAET